MTKGTAPFIGILMLDTAFERISGDAGNPASYPFPVRIKVVPGAGSLDVVRPGGPNAAKIDDFVQAAQALEAEGAVGIISTCGFLVHFQEVLAAAVRVPVLVSALSLYPMARAFSGNRRPCIMTASAQSLRDGALEAAGIDARSVTVLGMENCTAFADAILSEKSVQPSRINSDEIRQFVVQQAAALIRDHPSTGCFLLECGNLPPYAVALRAVTDRPVLSILDGARMMWCASLDA